MQYICRLALCALTLLVRASAPPPVQGSVSCSSHRLPLPLLLCRLQGPCARSVRARLSISAHAGAYIGPLQNLAAHFPGIEATLDLSDPCSW